MDALERFAAGDEDAFEVLFRQHQAEVYRWIVRVVRHPAAAEDLTVETFWRVYSRRNRFDPRRPFGPWLRRVATRVALDYLRSADHSFADDPAVAAPAAADPVEQRELRQQIEQAFSSLPAALRAAATLALIEEEPYNDIADALDISVSAVKMRVSRAVHLLRTRLLRMGVRI